jgi:hypothetical protein
LFSFLSILFFLLVWLFRSAPVFSGCPVTHTNNQESDFRYKQSLFRKVLNKIDNYLKMI